MLKRNQNEKFTKTVNMVKDAGEPVKNFVEMSKNNPKFKDYYRDFTDVGAQIFKIRKKLRTDFAELKECEGIKALKEQGK